MALQGGELGEASWAQGGVGKGGSGGSRSWSRLEGLGTGCGRRGVKNDPSQWHGCWRQIVVWCSDAEANREEGRTSAKEGACFHHAAPTKLTVAPWP